MKCSTMYTVILLLALVSCAPRPPLQSGPSPVSRATVIMDQGRAIPVAELPTVRVLSEVTTYQLGRLPSKDRRTMHEAHRVYRLTASPRWWLDPNAQPFDPSGPLFHDEELEAEKRRQRGVTAELEEAKANLEAIADKTVATLESLADTQGAPTDSVSVEGESHPAETAKP